MDYYNLDQILLGEERVPVTVKRDCSDVGCLCDPNKEDLKESERILIPFWQAVEFVESDYVTMEELPGMLDKETLKDLEAKDFDMIESRYKQINLKKLSEYFFDIGVSYYSYLAFSDDIEEELKEKLVDLIRVLQETFEKRYKTLLEKAFFVTRGDPRMAKSKDDWTNVEYNLFFKARNACHNFELWERDTDHVQGRLSKKRKRIDAIPHNEDDEDEVDRPPKKQKLE